MKLTRFTQSVAGVAVTAVMVAGCGASDDQAAQQPETSPADDTPTKVVEADLVSGATDLDNLIEISEGIVIATATTSEPGKTAGAVTTNQEFETTHVLKGDPGVTFVVNFTGGATKEGSEDHVLELDGQPQFTPSASFLLFLLGERPDGTYMITGGPQGRYETDGDKIVSAVEGEPVVAEVTSLTVDELSKAIGGN